MTERMNLAQYRQHVGASSVSASGRVVPVSKPAVKESLTTQRPQYALGRLKTGEMNKTEAEYNAHLEALKAAGDIVWFKFEAVKLRLADKTFLTVDFAVMASSGELEMHEVKGFMEDDANVKLKVAAAMYPFVFKLVRKAKEGRWDISSI